MTQLGSAAGKPKKRYLKVLKERVHVLTKRATVHCIVNMMSYHASQPTKGNWNSQPSPFPGPQTPLRNTQQKRKVGGVKEQNETSNSCRVEQPPRPQKPTLHLIHQNPTHQKRKKKISIFFFLYLSPSIFNY